MKITSNSFEDKGEIPSKHSCEGVDVNPHLLIEEIPENAKTLVLIVDDPDAVKVVGKEFLHWLVYEIPVEKRLFFEVEENSVPGIEGMNDFNKTSWKGPCPPSDSGEHRYYFRVYALDEHLSLDKGHKREKIEEEMKGHILDEAELVGVYGRKNGK